jgi:hypothetical protein
MLVLYFDFSTFQNPSLMSTPYRTNFFFIFFAKIIYG